VHLQIHWHCPAKLTQAARGL